VRPGTSALRWPTGCGPRVTSSPVWLGATLRPRGPYPVLAISGEQGSTKTVLSKLLRALIDPNVAPVRALVREERDLVIAANHSYLLAFDNLSDLPASLSDAFCRLASGGSFSIRKLYTDDDEVLFQAARPILLNGIEDVIRRPDLAAPLQGVGDRLEYRLDRLAGPVDAGAILPCVAGVGDERGLQRGVLAGQDARRARVRHEAQHVLATEQTTETIHRALQDTVDRERRRQLLQMGVGSLTPETLEELRRSRTFEESTPRASS